jgi:hypothetical protein
LKTVLFYKVMNPKKPAGTKSKPAGISLEPSITTAARRLAGRQGFASLSAYVRHVLVGAIRAAGETMEDAAQTMEQVGRSATKAAKRKQAAGRSKIRKRRKT